VISAAGRLEVTRMVSGREQAGRLARCLSSWLVLRPAAGGSAGRCAPHLAQAYTTEAWRGGLGFGRRRWLTVHQIIGALILLNAALIIVPVGGDLLDAASEIVQGRGSMEAFAVRA
jgi:hypothetical protein